MNTSYDVGDVFFAYMVVRDGTGTQTAVTDITFAVSDPLGVSTAVAHRSASSGDLAIVNYLNSNNKRWVALGSSTGVYVAELEIDQPGLWWWRWEATDPIQFAEEGSFWVHTQHVQVESS